MNKERWAQLSFAEQLGHIGSELSRVQQEEESQERASRNSSLERALEMLDLTLDDQRWRSRNKELARLREAVSDWFCDQRAYNIPLKILVDYCTQFILRERMARLP